MNGDDIDDRDAEIGRHLAWFAERRRRAKIACGKMIGSAVVSIDGAIVSGASLPDGPHWALALSLPYFVCGSIAASHFDEQRVQIQNETYSPTDAALPLPDKPDLRLVKNAE